MILKMKLEILGDKPIYHNSKTKEETLLWLENRIKMYLKNDVKKSNCNSHSKNIRNIYS